MKNQPRFINHHSSIFFLLTFVCLLFPFGKAAASWNSFIINFDKNDYGKGSQTWQIAPYDNSWVYFANRNGMLQFDGNSWKVFPLKNASDVRSVKVSAATRRIYVGGINEFGYFEPDGTGALAYHCMSDTLDGSIRYLGNVWGIHETDNIVYFQGDRCVVKCVDGQYSVIKMDGKIDCSNMVNGVLYLGTDRGVWNVAGNKLRQPAGTEPLEQMRIRGIIPYREGVLVVTAYDGLFYCDGHSMTQFVTGAERFMHDNEVFCVAKKDDKIALGTVHKGVVLVDVRTSELRYFNENNGLKNNTVLSVAFDGSGNLWAGLDSGIDYICLSSPFTNLYNYPYSYGTGYSAAVKDGLLYMGTNRGLYYTRYPVVMNGDLPDIRPVPQSSGQVWKLCQIGDDLFCLHDRGLFLVEGATMRRISDVVGAWNCQPVLDHPDMMYVGVYSGLYLFVKNNGEWQMASKVGGLNDSCQYFEQETAKVIWIYNTEHLLRIELNDELNAVINTRTYGPGEGFFNGRDVCISKIDGHIYFSTPKGFYDYEAEADSLKTVQEMNTLMRSCAYSRIAECDNRVIGLNPHEVFLADIGAYKHGSNTGIYPLRQSQVELLNGFESVIPLSDSLIILPYSDGFTLFTLPDLKQEEDRSNALYIRNMYISYPKDSLVYTANFLREKPTPVIDHTQNSVRFEYALAFFTATEDVHFRYRLNDGDWSDYTTSRTKEYSDLREGDYTFEVKVIFPDGTYSSDSISFSIRSPWYRTTLAYACYTLLTLLVLWLLYHLATRRVEREKSQALQQKDEQMQAMEQEYQEEKTRREDQIMQLEKEKLEHDLQHKSQELANLMINFARKNEVLTEIKAEILKVSAQLKGEGSREEKQKLMVINNMIDVNMESDEVLKRIEEEFDLVHNNFMKRLVEKHPDLSPNERMMCAYLKMNLSTKEIAPLLNISIRGVETIRYRLRKKFGLEREDGLIDYLDQQL